MYEHVRGRLDAKTPAEAVVDVGGIGFVLSIPLTTYDRLPATGAQVLLFTHLVVREDSHRLFGFASRDERVFFRTLQAVSGVGPAVALQVVSSVSLAEFSDAVAARDAARLRRIRGIGRKLSERLVVELKDALPRISPPGAPAAADPIDRDALLALEALGFSRASSEAAVAAARAESGAPPLDAGDLVRRALRHA